MMYVCAGFAARVADPPYHLGTIIRNSLKNPDLFSCECPDGHRAWAYAYSGSPLSGRFDLGMACPECGWYGWVTQIHGLVNDHFFLGLTVLRYPNETVHPGLEMPVILIHGIKIRFFLGSRIVSAG